jgi:hypothetical protein
MPKNKLRKGGGVANGNKSVDEFRIGEGTGDSIGSGVGKCGRHDLPV